jgi:8-oxo-dGTP diphosphatase
LERYDPEQYGRPSVAVDLVILTVIDGDLKVIVVRRGEHPFRGWWSLPGGFVRVGRADDRGESVDEAAQREMEEETGLPRGAVYLEQLYTFGAPDRDPRTRVISVAYYALVRSDLAPVVTAGADAAEVDWVSVRSALAWPDSTSETSLAFDHREILTVALERIRGKVDYTPIAFDLVPATFRVADLRIVHEAIKGEPQDPSNFRRGFQRMLDAGLVEQAPGVRHTGARPARVYRFRR